MRASATCKRGATAASCPFRTHGARAAAKSTSTVDLGTGAVGKKMAPTRGKSGILIHASGLALGGAGTGAGAGAGASAGAGACPGVGAGAEPPGFNGGGGGAAGGPGCSDAIVVR